MATSSPDSRRASSTTLPLTRTLLRLPRSRHQDPVISHREAAMTPRDLGLIDADIAFEVTADHEHGAVNRDDGRRPFREGDESK